ncbi:MAG: hypothetical protein EXS63_04380 [Candidatus Omnitrophica bacterium]|nr:hypothetical protein [Candidatus Omnitrophota bacterium]
MIIPVGTISSGQIITAAYQVIVTSGVTVGKHYNFTIQIHNTNNLSEKTVLPFEVEGDPLFDEGTILGKVFNDKNKNGVQDKGEDGVPGVRLATEQGIVILTDDNGMYSIPAVKEGRHIVKIDAHSLPDGTEFITEESYLVKTTPGILSKVSFAVYIPESEMPQEFGDELRVMVTQGLDTSHPVLAAEIEPSVLKLGVGRLQQDGVFRFALNYAEFAATWYLEIRDELGKEVWTGFGIGAPPREVVWGGQRENGILVSEGMYSYQLKVEDKDKHQDWSPLYFFRVLPVNVSKIEESKIPEIPPIGDFNLFKDGKQSIPLVAKPTIRIHGSTKPGYKVFANDYPVSVSSEGKFETEIYTSPGEKEIHVRATSPQGESVNYDKKVKVKDSTFFMAGLSEGQAGIGFVHGNKETAGRGPAFKEDLYEDGRLSYYLKGKLKGKFLIKSHYDTGDKQQALFTNLDPEAYYPVYGDASKRTYDAESQQRFYVLVEMDRSFAQWGSFKTAFTDTELASYERTLSGLKVHYETKSATAYGDAKRGFTAFSAKSEHQADHNEFASTGGTLYYFRNRLVIQGSEKIRVEVRDKVQDMPVYSVDLISGRDYEIDYSQGRIMLNKPLDAYASSDVLASNDIISGNPVYLVTDYEYDPGFSAYDSQNRGLRGYVHMGDHVRVGVTAIEEKRDAKDYDMRGADAQFKLGRNTKITAEYAESHLQQTGQSVSYNGGLSFADVALSHGQNTGPRGGAYLFKGETKPVKNVELSGYLQGEGPNFSSSHSMSQSGQQKYGIATKYKVTDHLFARYRFDYDEMADLLKPYSANDVTVPFDRKRTHTVQGVYDDDQWFAEAEYLKQAVAPPETNLLPTFESESPFSSEVSGKLGYHLNERLLPYVKVATTVNGEKPNHQFGGGLRYRVTNGMYAHFEQLIGNVGDSTQLGFEKYQPSGMKDYATLKAWDNGGGIPALTSTIGNSFSLSPKSRFYSERQHSSYQTGASAADVFGNQTKINDHWDAEAKLERRHLDNSTFKRLDQQASKSLLRTNSFNTVSGGFTFHPDNRLKLKTSLEGRFDQESPDLWQVVMRNDFDYKLTKDLSVRSKLNYGKSRFTDPTGTPADFMEFNSGLAYRPVENDRLQILGRYTYLRNLGNDIQFDTPTFLGMQTDETDHIWATDVSYDVNKYVTLVEKLAYKTALFETSVSDQAIVGSLLWAHRFNFHVTRKWDIALEYRALWQRHDADTLRQGPMVEIDREFYEYIRLGVGYNFTDFSDDIRASNKVSSHGPFVRLTGKF